MRSNKKNNRLWAILLCVGLVIGGIGAGVSFADFTRMSYAGDRYPDQLPVQSFTAIVRSESRDSPLHLYSYQNEMLRLLTDDAGLQFRADEEMEPGELEVEIRYRGAGVRPEIWCRTDDVEQAEMLQLSAWTDDPVAMVLGMKELLLEDLKEYTLGTYHSVRLEEVILTGRTDDLARVLLPDNRPLLDLVVS